MKQKSRYESPAVLRKIPLRLEGEILSGSVKDNMTINSMGQEVQNFDFNFTGEGPDDGFNHQWN